MQAAYDPIADWYDTQVRASDGLLPFHMLAIDALLGLVGDVKGRDACDLACGQGILTRELAQRGARVVGVDLSQRLLDIAQREEADAPLGATYRRDDAQTLATLADASFDAVTCNLALMDIPDFEATGSAVRRVLRPGGAFTFSITHPCIVPPGSWWTTVGEGGPGRHVRGYFSEGYATLPDAPGVRGRVGTHHRTLATYLNTLADAGFTLERIVEPQATGAAAARQPGAVEAPMFLVARFRREPTSAAGA